MNYIFSEYNTLHNTYLPYFFVSHFHQNYFYIHPILKDVTIEQANHALYQLDLYALKPLTDITPTEYFFDPKVNPLEYCPSIHSNILNRVVKNGKPDLENDLNIIGLSISECFAIASAGLMAFLCKYEDEQFGELEKVQDTPEIIEIHGDYLACSTEAAALAYGHEIRKGIRSEIEQKLIEGRSKGGKNRKQKYIPLKEYVNKQWTEKYSYLNKSNVQIANEIYSQMPQELKLIF